ncbi:hypothetical protein JYT20_01575 [Rhodothermus sp. AH-315-K08]|nr:hypothetical protein [Rhodothermus sp. AH-315-K08]
MKFYLSAYKPIDVLKGGMTSGRKGQRFRNGLVVLQFSISIALIICTLLVRNQMLFMVFAALAVVIACLGLWGLAAFAAEKRTKEIGIRKSLGSTVPSLLLLLVRDFTKWVLLANIIA